MSTAVPVSMGVASSPGETGLSYYRARYYHPTLQRFISEDPIEFLGGDFNLYSYVLNNPLYYTDPTGLDITLVFYPTAVTHISVQVTGNSPYGFYPAGHDWLAKLQTAGGLNVPGEIRRDTGQGTECIRITTSPEADRAMQAYINSRMQDPGTYNWHRRNCATFAEDVLGAGGVGASNTIDPGTFMQHLREMLKKAHIKAFDCGG